MLNREWQVLSVLVGPKVLADVVVQMCFVSKGGHQEGETKEQIPCDSKAQHRLATKVSDLVDEERRAVEGKY